MKPFLDCVILYFAILTLVGTLCFHWWARMYERERKGLDPEGFTDKPESDCKRSDCNEWTLGCPKKERG